MNIMTQQFRCPSILRPIYFLLRGLVYLVFVPMIIICYVFGWTFTNVLIVMFTFGTRHAMRWQRMKSTLGPFEYVLMVESPFLSGKPYHSEYAATMLFQCGDYIVYATLWDAFIDKRTTIHCDIDFKEMRFKFDIK